MNDISKSCNASLDDLVADVVDQFMERVHRGEQPGVEDYAERHPEAAALLRQILPALQVLQPPSEEVGAAAPDGQGGTLGDFRILREVGRGGMGIVYEAEQISLGRRVALKVLPFAATLDPRQLQRFHNEARAAASLHHEHIVPVFAVGQERGVHYFAMQFIEGRTLADLVTKERRGAAPTGSGAPMADLGAARATPAADTAPIAGRTTTPPVRAAAFYRQVAEWGIQAAEALEHAHGLGIVHRDIKPGNLMIDGHGQLWIADFGLARKAADSDLTMTGDLLGTLRYMSPEQALAKHDLVDHRSDVYSLGATLYELLTLHPAAEGKDRQDVIHHITQADVTSLRRHDRSIPADLETIVLKALAKEPDGRYATAKEFAADLRRYIGHEPIRARRPSLRQRLAKWAQRNRPAVIAATVAAFVITTVLGAAGGFGYQAEQNRAARELDKFQIRQDQLAKDMNRLFDESENRRREIHTKLADPTKACDLILSKIDDWQETIARARAGWQSAKNLATSNDDVMTAELAKRLQQVDQELEEDEADLKIAKKLDEIWMEAVTRFDANWNSSATLPQYEKLFRELGFDWKTSQPAQIASKIKQMRLRYVLVGALDVWANLSKDDRAQCLETCRLTDPDTWRNQVRQEKIWHDRQALERLAREADPGIQPTIILNIVADRLADAGGDGSVLLRSVLLYYPQDFWLHRNLGTSMRNPDQKIGCFQAALAIRPRSAPTHNLLGAAYMAKNDLDGAILHFRKALELNPNNINAHNNLGATLYRKGQFSQALEHLRRAHDLGLENRASVKNCERLVKLDQEVPALLKGSVQPESVQKWLDYAYVCELKKDHASAAAIWKLKFHEITMSAGKVTADHREQSHEVKLQAGKTYVIDLESKAFDTFLVLMDAQGKKLADNDDIIPGIDTNSRLMFTPPADGTYRLAASAFQNSGVGPYTLTIREFIK